jgi:hypothetical protein
MGSLPRYAYGYEHLGVLTFAIALGACSSDEEAPPTADPASVFETLGAATPNKLRGVWEQKSDDNGKTVQTRLRFAEGQAIGAARCIPADRSRSLVTGGGASLSTTALDEARGKFTLGAVNFRKTDGDLVCSVVFAGNTYDFTITEHKLALTTANSTASITFEKVGD